VAVAITTFQDSPMAAMEAAIGAAAASVREEEEVAAVAARSTAIAVARRTAAATGAAATSRRRSRTIRDLPSRPTRAGAASRTDREEDMVAIGVVPVTATAVVEVEAEAGTTVEDHRRLALTNAVSMAT